MLLKKMKHQPKEVPEDTAERDKETLELWKDLYQEWIDQPVGIVARSIIRRSLGERATG